MPHLCLCWRWLGAHRRDRRFVDFLFPSPSDWAEERAGYDEVRRFLLLRVDAHFDIGLVSFRSSAGLFPASGGVLRPFWVWGQRSETHGRSSTVKSNEINNSWMETQSFHMYVPETEPPGSTRKKKGIWSNLEGGTSCNGEHYLFTPEWSSCTLSYKSNLTLSLYLLLRLLERFACGFFTRGAGLFVCFVLRRCRSPCFGISI